MDSRTYKEQLATLTTFIFDVDGVFTNGHVLLLPDHEPVRTFFTRDAYAVQHAIREGYRIIIMTGGKSKGVEQSFERLGVTEFHHSVANKAEAFDALVTSSGIDPTKCAYMGDDMPDLRVMQKVAFPCCPADAATEVKAISKYVSGASGGNGCVRDLLEQALKLHGKWLTENGHTW